MRHSQPRSWVTPLRDSLEPLMRKIESGEIDPSGIITHVARLEDGPALYKKFRDKEDGCIKVVMKPWN
jgi:threonine dehydrogenase-like Zn-dependent dehydrogenase